MKTLYESILSSTGTGKIAYKKQIENCEFTPELVKMLENEVAYYKPHDGEFMKLIKEYIRFAGNSCCLNWIDTSEVTDMRNLFSSNTTRLFNGDISGWDVSNVKDMWSMFEDSKFNGNISDWDVSNVKDMWSMFEGSKFNGNISDWDVSNVVDMSFMFCNSKFNQNISKWDVSNVRYMNYMFKGSDFNKDISKWDVKKVEMDDEMFTNCPIKPEYKPKFNSL